MSIALKTYKDAFVQRFDKDGIVPYLSASDFEGLKEKEGKFENSIGINIAYFLYYYDNYRTDKYILFCHGLGPGHSAYMREIEHFAKKGYLVLSLDYTGCDKSDGETMISVNEPTRDIHDLLMYVKAGEVKEFEFLKNMEVCLVGHSLGGYSALNAINIHPFITKAVIISGFVNVIKEMMAISKVPFKFVFRDIVKYEDSVNKDFNRIDNMKYLKTTSDKILFIHSKDDPMVPYDSSVGYIIKKIKNANLDFLVVEGKAHNPNYTKDAISYMQESFRTCNGIKDESEKKAYMDTRSAMLMTVQDEEVYDKILAHLEK